MKGKKNKKQLKYKRPFKSLPEIKKNPRNSKTDFKKISDISFEDNGKTFLIRGTVEKVIKTSGPTLFFISDGTGTFPAKGFEGAGVRAYPSISEKDGVKAKVEITEFNGMLEGSIRQMNKLSSSELHSLSRSIEETENQRAKVSPPEFMIKSPILDKLRDSFIKAAQQIRLAIIKNRPIIVRHHNDTDGYSSGFALERAILPLIEKQHLSEKAAWEFYTRSPCSAPFYEIDDSIRDAANSLRNVAKFSNKLPLVIIADNGSSPEDLMAIKHGKVLGMDFVVIDHHFSSKDVISSEVLTHINPFLVGEDGTHFSAGMLCTEFARFINPEVKNISQIPAMAGLADRIDLGNPGAVVEYLKIAEKQGYSKELLSDISTVIDFVSAKLRFLEAREYIEVIFGEPRRKQQELVELMAPYIKNLEAKALEIAKSSAKLQKLGNTYFQELEIEKTFPGFGFYPKPGRAISILHEHSQISGSMSRLVTVGLMDSAITFRATDNANFSIHELIENMNNKLKGAFVEGGGHKNAGSITFPPSKKPEIISFVKSFVKSR